MTTIGPDDLLERFRTKAEALGVRVERLPGTEAIAPVVASEAQTAGGASAVVSSELRRAAPRAIKSTETRVAIETARDAASVRDAPLAMTFAHAAYAETGSVLLAEPDLADRSVGMLSGTLIVLVSTDALLMGLDDAATALRAIASRPGGGYATIMTGPSRTADIERVLTVGVQGPGRVVVLFVDDLG